MDYEKAWNAIKTLVGDKAAVWRRRAEGDWPKPDQEHDVAKLLAQAYGTLKERMEKMEG